MMKAFVFWVIVGISALLLWQLVRSTPANQRTPEISYSQFLTEVDAGNVARVSVTGSQIDGQYRNGKGSFRLTGPNDQHALLDRLREKGVDVWFKDAPTESLPLRLLGSWAPLILLGALWFFMIRQQQKRRNSDGDARPGAPIEPR